MLDFTQETASVGGRLSPVDSLWITQGFPVDNSVDKLWTGCGWFPRFKLSTAKSTRYPQGYPQGYPQEKSTKNLLIAMIFSILWVKKRQTLLHTIYILI